MTYNIRLDLQSDGVNKWANRRDQFVGQIGLMHPAILGLQEVVRGQQADLEKAFPTYAFLGLPREGGPMGESANLAFDRTVFKVTKSGTFWLSPTPSVPSKGWDAAYSRVASWAHLVRRSDGRKFLALNPHLALLAGTALVGSYTTFSTWMLETQRLSEERQIWPAVANIVVSVALGLAAAAFGLWLGGRA